MPALEPLDLAHLPTPLEPARNLGRRLGIPLLIKRDDCTGLATGGNKARKLAWIVADALRAGADTLVTFGGIQSNHARMTAAAAARSGLGCTLILGGAEPAGSEGNLLLDRIFGAELVFLRLAPDELTGARLEAEFDRVEETLRARKRVPYRIPAGGSGALGVAACAVAFHEMLSQMQAAGRRPGTVVVAFGTGGTFAGLALGNIIAGRPARVTGISCAPPGMPAAVGVAPVRELIEGGARTLAAILSAQPDRGTTALGPLGPAEVREILAQIRDTDMEIDYSQAGRAYGATTPECLEAIRITARDEGILLDPVYTSKAMAGLVEMARRGGMDREGEVVFWHTGGIPGLFPYAAEILRPEGSPPALT